MFQRCVGTPQCDVVANRCADQLRILEYETDGAIQFLGGDVAKIDAADADRSFGGIVKTGNQRGKRGFSGSGWSDECGHRACCDIQTDVVKCRGGAVGVGHMVDGHVVAVRMFRLRRLGERRYAQIPFDAQCRSAGELIAPLHIADRGDGGWQHHGGQRGGQHLRRGHIAGLYQQHADGEIDRGKQGGGDECLGNRTPTNERPAPIVVLFDEVIGGALVLPQ